MSYETMCRSQLGPVSLEPGLACSVQEFRRGVVATCATYQGMSHGVPLPAERPEYTAMLGLDKPIEVDVDKDTGRPRADEQKRLRTMLRDNARIVENFERDATRMRHAVPKPAKPPGREGEGSDEESDVDPALEFRNIKLQIVVVKALDIPQGDFLYSLDPYVAVNVVDFDPLADGVAEKGLEWYRKFEQYHAQTPVKTGTASPEWRAQLEAEVRSREDTHVHFRLFDRDELAAMDRFIGHTAVDLKSVLKDAFYTPKALALSPANKKNAREWAAIKRCRLYVSMNWEGYKSQIKSNPAGFGGDLPSAPLDRRREGRRVRIAETTGEDEGAAGKKKKKKPPAKPSRLLRHEL